MIQLATFSETEVIEQILKGNKSLFELIIRKYNPELYKIGRAYNYNHEDTQDLMQDTFIDAYKNLAQFENRSSFKTWIIRIMLNNCFHKKQKSAFKNEISKTINENSTPMYSKSNTDISHTVHNRHLASIIEDAVLKIPYEYRIVFSLREMNGLNVAETSDVLNISETNVKARLSRAKMMLKKEIEKKYAATELFDFNLVYCNSMVENVMSKINSL